MKKQIKEFLKQQRKAAKTGNALQVEKVNPLKVNTFNPLKSDNDEEK